MFEQNNRMLHITLNERNRTILILLNQISAECGVPYEFHSFGNNSYEKFGSTSYDEENDKANRIEINSETNPDELYMENGVLYVSDFDFLAHINAVFHEESHCIQASKLRNQNNKLGTELTASYIAETYSPAFCSDYYNYLPGEVYAECFALRSTYDYLYENFSGFLHFSKGKTDKAMLDFVNKLCYRNPDYCLNVLSEDSDAPVYYKSVKKLLSDINIDNMDSCYCRIKTKKFSETNIYNGLSSENEQCLNQLENINDKTLFVSCLIIQSIPKLKKTCQRFNDLSVDSQIIRLKRKAKLSMLAEKKDEEIPNLSDEIMNE